MGAEVEGGVIHRRDGFDQCRALAQAQGEIMSKRRQDAHADVAVGTGDERVFADCLDWRGRWSESGRKPKPRRLAWRSARAAPRGERRSAYRADNRGSTRRGRRPSPPLRLRHDRPRPRRSRAARRREDWRDRVSHRINAVSAPAPSCGGGQGWGVARVEEVFECACFLLAEDGATPLLDPPPQGGRRRVGAVPA